jgi:hypothetical protein
VTAVQPDGVDEPQLAQVPQVAAAWVGLSIMVIQQMTTGDHPKRADCRERSRI